MEEYEIEVYELRQGKTPFYEWLNSLDKTVKSKIQARLGRVKVGNMGDYKSVGDGVFELKMHFDGGVRVYFAIVGNKLVLLLCGGNKSSQSRDIKLAKLYLYDYLNSEKIS